ncbi:ryncolin-3 [Strongylocentrotus purpuratus]|uniref:Fibrinogen C-terminal domain-containing protein n=1 Tax=Strongylocentrotus purpuratus TaxID=7668 RepID=A0A7M7NKK5_STRPU|nr:ryncolin-3 [Strongylocentrotus purpuratus]
MDALKERVRVLEALFSELLDSKDARLENMDEYSVDEDLSSSFANTDTPGLDMNSAPSQVSNDNKPLLQEVLVPHQPLPPLREVIPQHTTHNVPNINAATPPRNKPFLQDDMLAPDHILVPLNETDISQNTKADKDLVPPKKPSSITSTRLSSSSSSSSSALPEEQFVDEGGEHDDAIGVSPDNDAIVQDTSPPAENDGQSAAHFPDVIEVATEFPIEHSMTSAIEGGSYLIYSSSDGGAEDLFPDAEEESDSTDPTQVRGEDGPRQPGGRNRSPFMNIMTSQNGHSGDLNKPRWKIFKELMDLKTLRGTFDGKRPRPKGKGKPNNCILDGCLCLRKKGYTEDGIYYMENFEGSGRRGKHIRLFCDMTTEDGGWTVIQRRQNGTTNFYRGWDDYSKGFGYLDADFWIGNTMIHSITSQTRFMIRFEFTDWDDQLGYAEYNGFRINDESDNFRLILGQYMGGNAGDSMTYHNNTQFSTRDRDHDVSIGNCAFLRQAGYWFRGCNKANPNGRWLARSDARGLNGAVVNWGTWEGRKYTYCLKSFRIMIRSQNALSAMTPDTEERTVTEDGHRGRNVDEATRTARRQQRLERQRGN